MLKYTTPEELAKRFHLNRMTIYRLIRAGKIPSIRIGKSYRIPEEDLAAWIKEQRVVSQGGGQKLRPNQK